MRRLYRLLLRAFPGPFRARFGDDMADLFVDRVRDARRRGVAALCWLLVRTILDVTRAGWRERREARPFADAGGVMNLESIIHRTPASACAKSGAIPRSRASRSRRSRSASASTPRCSAPSTPC